MNRLARIISAALMGIALAASAATPIDGTFALQSGSAKTRGFLSAETGTASPLDQLLNIWMTEPAGETIRHYTVDMTKLLHVIVVSDDFKQFLHIHPVLGPDGHFTIEQSFPEAALYHIYADGEPQGIGQQVFRFDIGIGGKVAAATRTLVPTGTKVVSGPYTVELSTTTIAAGKDAPIAVHILRAGKPATDLHPYLGALAHAVFLNARDLTYVHVHPMPLGSDSMGSMPGMDMSSMPGMSGMGMSGMDMKPLPDSATSSPDMRLHLVLRERGTYKLWLQFRGGTSVYVAPFVITAS